jgi:hypothetical protein
MDTKAPTEAMSDYKDLNFPDLLRIAKEQALFEKRERSDEELLEAGASWRSILAAWEFIR